MVRASEMFKRMWAMAQNGIPNYEDLLIQVYPMWIDRQDRSQRCHETSNPLFYTEKQCKACSRWQKTCKLHQVTNCRNTELSHHVSECPMGMGHAPSCVSNDPSSSCLICVAFWETLELPGPGCRAVLWLCTADADHTWVGQSLKTWIKLVPFLVLILNGWAELEPLRHIVTIVTEVRAQPDLSLNKAEIVIFVVGCFFTVLFFQVPGLSEELLQKAGSLGVQRFCFDVRSMEWVMGKKCGIMGVHWNLWKNCLPWWIPRFLDAAW